MKIIDIFIIFCIIFTVDTTLLASEKNVHRECQLIAGYDQAKPFHFRNSKGVVVGFDADILREVLGSIGCQVVFKEIPWVRTLLYVEKGKIDIAIGASFKVKRTQWAYYSVPYKYINHWLYTRADKHIDVDSIDKFFNNKLKLGVVIGWGYPIEIRNELDIPKYSSLVYKVPTFVQLPKMLNKDRLDGIVAIPEMLRTEIIQNNFSHKFSARAQYKEELHFIFSKNSVLPKLVAGFNNALYQFVYSGRRKKILLKYGLN